MTYFPDYLKSYPNMDTATPIHISMNELPYGFRQHRHNFLEFSFVIEGTGEEAINGIRHAMSAGTFTFVLPYQVHELFTTPGETLRLYNCMFGMDLLMEQNGQLSLQELAEESADRPFVQLKGDEQCRMKNLIEDMYREYNSNHYWRDAMLQLRLKEILIMFDRTRRAACGNVKVTHEANNGNRSSSWPIIGYIHRQYKEELTLSELSDRFAMSASRISEVIKQMTGQTFLHFLHDLRIRHACSLLASTELTVSEVALESGYGSYGTFSRVFRQTKGMAPKEYRRRKQSGSFTPQASRHGHKE